MVTNQEMLLAFGVPTIVNLVVGAMMFAALYAKLKRAFARLEESINGLSAQPR